MTNDETQEATETEVTEAPAPQEVPTKVEDPEEVRAAAREALSGLRDNPAVPEALQNLATISELVKDVALEPDLVGAAQAVVLATLATPQLPAGSHAHLTVLFSHLLALRGEREAVDALYAEWIRHGDAFGAGHATPGPFQQETFVQRAADLLGWGLLDHEKDRGGIARFAAWIDSWNPRNKFRVRRVLDMLHRNFPAGGAWRTVHFPSGEGGGRPEHRGPRPQGQSAPKPAQPAAQPAAKPEGDGAEGDAGDEGDEGDEGEAQPASTDGAAQPGAQAPREGGKRRRRRGGRKNRGRAGGGAVTAGGGEGAGNVAPSGAEGEEDNRGNVKPPEPKYSDDDDTQPPGI